MEGAQASMSSGGGRACCTWRATTRSDRRCPWQNSTHASRYEGVALFVS